jgi:hypothetical protein
LQLVVSNTIAQQGWDVLQWLGLTKSASRPSSTLGLVAMPTYRPPQRPFAAPPWCTIRRQRRVESDYDSVGWWVSRWINEHSCKRHTQHDFAWDKGGTPNSSFATAMYHVASRSDVNMAFEVGTLRGCGSTLVLAKAMMVSRSATVHPPGSPYGCSVV